LKCWKYSFGTPATPVAFSSSHNNVLPLRCVAHTINPDKLAQSKKTATFETFGDKHVLTDGGRTIEIHKIAGGGHNDAFAMVYLPKEKILIEGDAYTPPAANAPPPTAANPFSVNLDENITRLKLDVKQIAPLHGPGVATMADLKAFITPRNTN